MVGAIIGDIVGSKYEWHNIKTKDFDLFGDGCKFTDDSVLTIAVGVALSLCKDNYKELKDYVIDALHEFSNLYPNCGFGKRYKKWAFNKEIYPYNSYGNGSAMRTSIVGFIAKNKDEVKRLSYDIARVTHNHYEGIKGAEAISMAIFLARQGKTKQEIKDYIIDNYYDLNFTLDEIRPTYTFNTSCQGSVPQAIVAFLESNSFADAIKNAVSIGGDSDTIACMTGGIAEAYYGVPFAIWQQAKTYLDEKLNKMVAKIEQTLGKNVNNIIKTNN